MARKALELSELWDNIIRDPKASQEDRLIARLARFSAIQNFVSKFREENPYWKSWIGPQLELWDEKRSLKGKPTNKRINSKDKPKNNSKLTKDHIATSSKADTTQTAKPKNRKTAPQTNKSAINEIKAKPEGKSSETLADTKAETFSQENVEKSTENLEPFPGDTFFLSSNLEVDPSNRPLEIDVDLPPEQPAHYRKGVMSRKDVTSLPLARREEKQVNKETANRKSRRQKAKQTSDPPVSVDRNRQQEPSLHPSWEAKRRMKQTSILPSILTGSSAPKKIVFTDDD